MESNGSTFEIGFYFQTLINNLREFFYQKIAEMEAFQDAQAAEIEALTTKLIVIGILAIALVIVIIIMIIAIRVSKGRRKRREMEAVEASLRREEQRLREERKRYEAQNRAMQRSYPQQEDLFEQECRLPQGCPRQGFARQSSPPQPRIIPERESKEVRERAGRTTQYIGNVTGNKGDNDLFG